MASPPKFTENADAPLTADELAGDRAASPQGSSFDGVNEGDGAASDSGMTDETLDDLASDESDVVATAVTRLPPG